MESPYFGDILGVKDGKYVFTTETYPVPVLNIYSDNTWGQFDKDSIYAQNETLLTDTDAQAFNVYIKGLCKAEVDEYNCLKTINQVTLEFFDCYLKGEG